MNVKIFVGSDSLSTQKALIKVLNLLDLETIELPSPPKLLAPPQNIKEKWGFSYAWPICDPVCSENEMAEVIVGLWGFSAIPSQNTEWEMASVIRSYLHFICKTQARKVILLNPIGPASSETAFSDATALTLSYDLDQLLKTINNLPSADHLTLSFPEFCSSVSTLVHDIKNGDLWTGPFAYNNHELKVKLFMRLRDIFKSNIVEKEDWKDTCEKTSAFEEGTKKNLTVLMEQWGEIYTIMYSSRSIVPDNLYKI